MKTFLDTACRIAAATVWALFAMVLWRVYSPLFIMEKGIEPIAANVCSSTPGCDSYRTVLIHDANQNKYVPHVWFFKKKGSSDKERQALIREASQKYYALAGETNFLFKNVATQAIVE